MKKILTILIGIGLIVAGSVSAYNIKKGDTPFSLWGDNWKEEMSSQIGHTNEYSLPVGVEVNLDNEMLGAAPIPTDNYDSFLTSPLSASASVVYVNALPTGVTSTIYTLFASDGTTPREKIYCTSKATSPNQLTGCVRGVSFSPVDGVIDETAGTGLSHSKNVRIAITDNINFSGKALAILNGSQPTDANNFDIGTASSTDGNKCLRFDNSDTDGQICRNASTGNLYWTLDGGSNTYNFTSSTFSQLIASSTGGLSIVDGEILINASSTTGGMIDGDNNYYQAIGNALEYTGNAIAVSTSTIVDQIATSTPTADKIVQADGSGKIDYTWLFPTSATGTILYFDGTSYVNLGIGSNLKMLLSNGTTPYWATSTRIYTTASDTLQISSDGVVTSNTNSDSYVLAREIQVYQTGGIRVAFDLASVPGVGNSVYGRIYINGTAVGTERTTASGTYTTYSEDFSNIKIGDKIQVYLKDTSQASTIAGSQNFRIYYTETATTTMAVVNI